MCAGWCVEYCGVRWFRPSCVRTNIFWPAVRSSVPLPQQLLIPAAISPCSVLFQTSDHVSRDKAAAAAGPRLHFTAGNGCPRTVHALAPPPRQPPARQVGRRTEEGENVNNNVQWTRTVLNTHSLQYIFTAPIVLCLMHYIMYVIVKT